MLARLIVSALLSVCLVASPALAQSAGPPQPAVSQSQIDALRPTVREEFGASSEFMAELIKTFPDEYHDFETRLITAYLRGELVGDVGRQMGFDFTSGLVPRAYEGWQQAPDADIVALVDADLAAARLLRSSDVNKCADFVRRKPKPDMAVGLPSETFELISRRNLMMMRAGRAGRAAKIQRAAPTESDYARVLDRYEQNGGDQRYVDAQTNPKSSELTARDICDSGIAWLEAVRAESEAMAARFAVQI